VVNVTELLSEKLYEFLSTFVFHIDVYVRVILPTFVEEPLKKQPELEGIYGRNTHKVEKITAHCTAPSGTQEDSIFPRDAYNFVDSVEVILKTFLPYKLDLLEHAFPLVTFRGKPSEPFKESLGCNRKFLTWSQFVTGESLQRID